MLLYDFKLSARNTVRQGKRTILLLLIINLSASVIIFVGGLYEYMFKSLEKSMIQNEGHFWIKKNKDADNFSSAFSSEKIEKIKKISGIKNYTLRGNANGVAGFEDQSAMFSALLFDSKAETEFLGNGKAANEIGKGLASSLNVKKGNWISGFTGYSSFSVQIDDIVTTESEENDLYYLKIPLDAFGETDFSMIDSIHFHIAKKNYTQTIEEIKNIFHENSFYIFNSYDSETSYVKQVKTIYENNLYFIMIALAITVFFSIALSYTMIISERSKEFGTMMTLGSSANHIIVLMLYEASFLAIIGFSLGYIYSSAAGLIINAAGGITMPPPPTAEYEIILKYSPHYIYPLAAFIEIFLVCNLSSFFVCRKIGNKEIVEQLNEGYI